MTPSRIHVTPISNLLDKLFYVPAYQRGYRWTARLLWSNLLGHLDRWKIHHLRS